jgi:GNAT superfamily N-acetyltransferase
MFTLPDAHAESYRPPHGICLVAWSDDLPVGCVALRPQDGPTAEVKRLWVHASARGQGLARRLMTGVEDAARKLGYRQLKLDTNSALSEAIALYQASGWTDIAPYTGAPADTWMGKPL